jgi:hypothetical protein
MTRKLLIVTALTACIAASADAQLCAGTASFSSGRMRAGVGAELPAGGKAYGAGLTWGQQSGVYFGGQIMRLNPTGGAESATDLQANVGYQTSFDGLGKTRFCPTAHFGITNLPGNQEGLTHFALGGTFGQALSSSDDMTLAPSLGLSWVHYSSGGVSDSWIEATVGAGFIFNRDVTFTPMVRLPLNQDGADPTFGISLSYNFGRPGVAGGRRRR